MPTVVSGSLVETMQNATPLSVRDYMRAKYSTTNETLAEMPEAKQAINAALT